MITPIVIMSICRRICFLQISCLILVNFQSRHHMFSSYVADNHSERKILWMGMFFKDIQSRILFGVLCIVETLWRRIKLVPVLMKWWLFEIRLVENVLLIMDHRNLLFWWWRLNIFAFGSWFAFGLFAPLYLVLILFPVRIDDELEKLNDFLVFSLVIQNHFKKLREFYFSWFVLVNRVDELFDFLSRIHKTNTD